MSTETHQAELLARWLSESPGDGVRPEPPSGLEADVVAAVSALRPDRAPAARLDIDDILFEVADGPLAEVVDPAAVGALGALLDEGGLPPGLDPDVLDAVSTLRPERAPAARVTIDDILAEVSSGPLSGMPSTTSPLPPSTPETMTPLASPANRGPTGKRPPAWLWRSLGGLAVAATALLFVVPMATQTMEAPPASDQAPRYKVAGAAQPMEESDRQTESVVELEAAVEDGFEGSAPVEQPLHAPSPAPPPPPAAAPKASSSGFSTRGRTDRSLSESMSGGVAMPAEPSVGGGAMSVAAAPPAPSAGASTQTAPDAAPAPKGATAARDTYGSARGASAAAPEAAEPEPASFGLAEEEALDAGVEADRSGAPRRSASRSNRPRKQKRTRAPAAESAPADDAVLGDAADVPEENDLTALRAAAWMGGAPPSTRTITPAAWEAVERARATSDVAAETAALEALLDTSDPAIAQEAAGMLTQLHLTAGRTDLALAAIARGLARPGGHPAARPWLLALQGDVLSRRGDLAGARESYRRAVAAR